ncbi:MAG: glutamate--tRNA ligase [Chlamydiota bacterium]
MTIRVRIAPSPTGDPHVGTAYMALFNMIIARHYGGKFILRIEDTDRTRSRSEYEENIYKALHWCNIKWDEGPDIGGDHGPYRQSERLDIYQRYSQQLLDQGLAYRCFCTAEELAAQRAEGNHQGYSRCCRELSSSEIQQRLDAGKPYVVRLKVPLEGECVYEDAIKGRISCPWADVDDQILMKSDGFPTYHLANIVDDHLMEISHVIRGDEWMTSTPKHILLYQYLGWQPPIFVHMPLLLGTDGKKLSKRRNPTSIFYYRDSGYLPEAFINFLTLMGYSMPGDREIYPLEDIIKEFDLKRIGISGAVFDTTKLEWLNQHYLINCIPEQELWPRIKQWAFHDTFMEKLIPLCRQRMKTFGDFMDLCNFFFINNLKLSEELLCPKKTTPFQAASILQALIWYMEANQNWGAIGLSEASRAIAEIFGANHKKVVMAILFGAIMGKKQGPPLFDSVELLGKERTRARLMQAIEFLGGISNKKLTKLQKAYQKGACQAIMENS